MLSGFPGRRLQLCIVLTGPCSHDSHLCVHRKVGFALHLTSTIVSLYQAAPPRMCIVQPYAGALTLDSVTENYHPPSVDKEMEDKEMDAEVAFANIKVGPGQDLQKCITWFPCCRGCRGGEIKQALALLKRCSAQHAV